MKRRSRVVQRAVGFIGLVTGASCAESPVQPMRDLSVTEAPPRFTIYDPAKKQLGVTIGGWGKIEREGADQWYRYKGSFTGGVRPFKMYWFVELCYTDGYCTDRHQVASGTDVDSVDVFIPSDAKWLKIHLFAGDAQSESFVGNAQKPVIGPASDVPPGTYPYCVEEAPTFNGETWYPFHTPVPPDPIHQTGDYYVKSCGLGRVYKED